MKTSVLLAAASALVVCAGSASAAEVPAPSSFGQGTVPHLSVLYNQNDNDQGIAFGSQMFESTYAAYDTWGADDFAVPAGTEWIVKEVDVTGVYIVGPGPITAENVYFYANNSEKNLPGKLIATYSNVVGTDNGTGSLVIPVPKTVLKGGASGTTYWVSVQANCNYMKKPACGEWGWEARDVQSGNKAAWKNPGNVYGYCKTWHTLQHCFSGWGPDLMFALKGVAR